MTRRSFTSPLSSTSASQTVAMKLANEIWAADAAAGARRQRRCPSPTSAPPARPPPSGAACHPAWARRKATGSLPAFGASSSMKLSMAKTLLLGPTPRQKPVWHAPVARARTIFDAQVGDVVGHVRPRHPRASMIDTLLKAAAATARHHRRAGDAVCPAVDLAVLRGWPTADRDRRDDRCRAGCLPRASRPP